MAAHRCASSDGRATTWRIGTAVVASAALLSILAVPAEAPAQGSGDGFLFKRPVATLTLRGGFGRANARSEIFSFASRQLTIGRGDFSGFAAGAELGLVLTSRLGIDLGVGYAGSSTPSEYRDFVDQDDLPIEQTTSFRRVPVTASLRAYLTPRGRSVGHFAWIPAKLAPYVGGGGGMMWYSFRQTGAFIDDESRAVFNDTFTSAGWTPEAHAMAGIDLSLSPRFMLTGEGRYTWAKADMSDDFVGFNRIDLSGFAITAGIAVRF